MIFRCASVIAAGTRLNSPKCSDLASISSFHRAGSTRSSRSRSTGLTFCRFQATEIQFSGGRHRTHRRVHPVDIPFPVFQDPQQRTKILPESRPQVVPVLWVALEPVHVGDRRRIRKLVEHVEPVLQVISFTVRHERSHGHWVVPEAALHTFCSERRLSPESETVIDAVSHAVDDAGKRLAVPGPSTEDNQVDGSTPRDRRHRRRLW